MDSQTPITDEIQGYGVLDEEVLEVFRAKELSGSLEGEELIKLREKVLLLREEEIALLKVKVDMTANTSRAAIEMQQGMYHKVESIENADDQQNATNLLQNLEI